MNKLSNEKIIEIFKLIGEFYDKYLKHYEVKPVNLRDKSGNFTKDALVLVYLAQNYPDTKAVSKAELTEFIRNFYPDVSDVQQARHLSKQKGYNIISGTRGDIGAKIPAGYYKLVDLKTPYPSFKSNRRSGVEKADFEELKKRMIIDVRLVEAWRERLII